MKRLNRLVGFIFLLSGQSESIPTNSLREGRSWEKEACASRTQKDRYTCTPDGKIQCLEGWIGDLCQVPKCGNDCDPQHGYCVKPGECKCNLGYQGASCRECIPLPGCLHGQCTKSFTCHCEPGWSGMFCNNPECSEGCGKNGLCVAPDQCQCELGYQGDECNECSTRPGCLHGNCTKPLECQCEEGWTGELCDKPICLDTCHIEHGTCQQPGECICKLGYQGDTCDTCVKYPGCVNGDCDDPYECNCDDGWTGHLCDIPKTEIYGDVLREGKCQPLGSFLCFNGGKDVCMYDGSGKRHGDPVCRCARGFWGTWCQHSGNGSRTGVAHADIITIEGVEPRNKANNITTDDDVDILNTEKAADTTTVASPIASNSTVDAVNGIAIFDSKKL